MTELSQDQAAQARGRRTLLMIVGIAALPVALAYLVFFTGIGVPKNTVNEGLLLPDAASVEPLLPAEVWQEWQTDKHWRWLLPFDATCDESCLNNLYLTRQVHIRLGEKSPRVSRIALNFGGDSGLERLNQIKTEHPKLAVASVTSEVFSQWQAKVDPEASTRQGHTYYLVDQQGRAMMAYHNQDGNALLKDIKRALKYSIDYTQ